ncbi:hypothetical protein LY76DRAFT_301697 [Colletotrichum caudatum]|nr:hypothetical protein LY76DRAFT_301697 [Colletotrichum caudatum]
MHGHICVGVGTPPPPSPGTGLLGILTGVSVEQLRKSPCAARVGGGRGARIYVRSRDLRGDVRLSVFLCACLCVYRRLRFTRSCNLGSIPSKRRLPAKPHYNCTALCSNTRLLWGGFFFLFLFSQVSCPLLIFPSALRCFLSLSLT